MIDRTVLPIAGRFGCLLLLPLTGCGAPAGFPSLAPRPIEAIARQPERVAAALPRRPDPALERQVTALAGQLRADEDAWAAGVAATRTAIARARGAAVGSESWIEAQLVISRLESLRQATGAHRDAVADLRLAQAQSATPADSTTLDALWRRAVAQVEAQNSLFSSLAGTLPTG